MSLVLCPVCGNECSADAASCPKCGHPFAAEVDTVVMPPPQPKVIVRETPRKSGFPNWMFIPLALLLGTLVLGTIWLMSDNNNNENQNVNLRIRETASANTRTNRSVSTTEQPTTVNPPATADSTVVVPPSTTTQTAPRDTTISTVPPSTSSSYPGTSSASTVTTQQPPDKGNLEIKATIATRTGSQLPVKAEKFYLLNKDLSSILSKAGIEPEAGDYSSTVGAAIADPNRRDLLQKILAAIKPHIVASTQTDSTGKAVFKNVKPDNYYLFGVTKVGNSASVWDTSVTLNPGENTLALNGTALPAANSAGLSDSDNDY